MKKVMDACYTKNGKLHREDGPAVEYADGNKEWWVNGIRKESPAVSLFEMADELERQGYTTKEAARIINEKMMTKSEKRLYNKIEKEVAELKRQGYTTKEADEIIRSNMKKRRK